MLDEDERNHMIHIEGLEERYRVAREVIEDAGKLALDYFDRVGALTVHTKGPQDMTSRADLEIERLIRARLEVAFPEDGFL